ncbi:MAG: hypothetical protein WBF53_14670 [Litorimonas sp.]
MTGTSARDDWAEIAALFPLSRTTLGRSWNLGISSRMSRERLHVLRTRPGVGALDKMLERRDVSRVKALRTFAAVNLEQASAAFRITAVVNVTLPVVLLTVLNLVLPGSPAELFRFFTATTQGAAIIFTTLLVGYLIFLAGIMGYSVVQLSNARDIRHLIDLHAAERGIYFGLEDADGLQPG